MLTTLVDKRVLEDPPDAGRIGTDHRVHAVWQLPADTLEILDNSTARPVDVGAVLEDHVDVRDSEVGDATYGLYSWRRQQSRHQGIGHLIFNEIRAAPRPLG